MSVWSEKQLMAVGNLGFSHFSEVLLNGQLLTLIGDNLPDVHPLIQSPEDHITLPKLSFGFYVFRDAKANACLCQT